MAHVPTQSPAYAGKVLTPTAATAGPDTFDPGVIVLVENTDVSSKTATVAVPGTTKYGLPQPDISTLSIPAGDIAALGPYGEDLADPSDDLIDITVSSPTGVNLYAIRVARS